MAKFYSKLTDDLCAFIAQQYIFFTATAPVKLFNLKFVPCKLLVAMQYPSMCLKENETNSFVGLLIKEKREFASTGTKRIEPVLMVSLRAYLQKANRHIVIFNYMKYLLSPRNALIN
jgi:hypothetical protein